ncbi:ArsR/SmtB family transcription factor [Tepidamorphus sp. 3E244]|uniref:ArsR/SmtB family transcription factor n=1 Tax=Tepidamorphus sp. 3E244 TaxID=3385498 RepID=UPI0038FCB6E3
MPMTADTALRRDTESKDPANGSLEESAGSAADFLKLLANDRRLLVLCALADAGEMSVGTLAERVGLSQSALSQHLARMRAEGLLSSRRDGLAIYYSISDDRARAVLDLLHTLFCKSSHARETE